MKLETLISKSPLLLPFQDSKSGLFIASASVLFCSALNEAAPSFMLCITPFPSFQHTSHYQKTPIVPAIACPPGNSQKICRVFNALPSDIMIIQNELFPSVFQGCNHVLHLLHPHFPERLVPRQNVLASAKLLKVRRPLPLVTSQI